MWRKGKLLTSPSRVPSFVRLTVFAFAAAAAFASGPRFQFYGPMVRGFPGGYTAYHYRGAPWYFSGGFWYRPWRTGYRGYYPPVGLSLSLLPFGYTTVWFDRVPYYYYEGTYYTDAPSGGYLVAEPPPEGGETPRPPQDKAENLDSAALDALLIIPKKGQNEEQMITDRREAKQYAIGKSRYNPAFSDPSDPGTPRSRQAYLRAMRSYLEERGYLVE